MKKIIVITLIILLLSPDNLNASERNRILMDTARSGTLAEVQKIIIDEVGANYKIIQPHGIFTPLILAVWGRNDLTVIRALVDAGADVNFANHNGMTPLIFAQMTPMFPLGAQHDDALELTRILLDAGADINAGSEEVSWIIFQGRDGPFGLRSRLGSRVQLGPRDMTVLKLAVGHNRLEVVRFLIDRGVNINSRNSNGQTAFDIARMQGNRRMADVLMLRNNHVNLTLASAFLTFLKILPIISCLVWLYMHFVRHSPIQVSIFVYSLTLAFFWIVGWRLFIVVPTVKLICFLVIFNLYLLLYWFLAWESKGGASEEQHYSEAIMVEVFLLICLILVSYWMIHPLLADFGNFRLTIIFKIMYLGGAIAMLRNNFRKETKIALMCILCFGLLNFNTPAAYGTELNFQNLIRTGKVAHIEQVIKTDDINLEEHPYVLFDALRNPNPEVIQILLTHGANIKNRMNRITPIHLAALNLARGMPSEGEEVLPRLPLSFFEQLNY